MRHLKEGAYHSLFLSKGLLSLLKFIISLTLSSPWERPLCLIILEKQDLLLSRFRVLLKAIFIHGPLGGCALLFELGQRTHKTLFDHLHATGALLFKLLQQITNMQCNEKARAVSYS